MINFELLKFQKMKIKLLLIILLTSLFVFSQEKNVSQYYLGFRLIDNGAGELVRFGVVQVTPDGTEKITYINKINFFLQAAGEQESRANPDKINYWKTLKIDARNVNMLWKLKYAEFPYERSEDIEGWANLKYSASPGQLRYLSKYGFKKSITDFIYGEKAFQLLKDIQSPEWQYNYSMQ